MISPKQIATNFISIGINKTSLPSCKLFALGIFAGIFIALAGAGSAIASCTIQDPSLARFVNALVFPAGLVMVLLAGSELFTGNSLIIISVLTKDVSLSAMIKNWIIVFIGNFVGSMFIVLTFVYGHIPSMFQEGLAQAMVASATAKATLPFMDALLRGILCNILVCIAVWVAAASTQAHGKIIALYLPIVVFVLCGFEHCIANMFCIPAGLFVASEYAITSTALTWSSFFITNLIPVTIGNIIGGCMVGIGYWYIYLRDEMVA